MQSAGPVLHTMRVALLGDVGVGKRALIRKLTNKQHKNPIESVQELTPFQLLHELNIHLQSTNGPCQITLIPFQIDLSEYSKQQAYYIQVNEKLSTCDSALLMFSLLDRQSYKSTPNYYKIWTTVTQGYRSIVLVSTKVDEKDVKIKQKMITFHRKKNMQFVNTSAKAGYNILKPFQFLFRQESMKQFSFIHPENFIDFTSQIEFKEKLEFEKQVEELEFYSQPPMIEDQY